MKLKLFFSFFVLFLFNHSFGQLSSQQSVVGIETSATSNYESPEKWFQESFGTYIQENEIIEKRDANSKHFRNGDGTITALIAAGNINYKEGGQWKTIFHSIEQSSTGFANIHNLFKTYYPLNANGHILTKLPNGSEFKDLLNMRMYFQTGTTQMEVKNISSSPGNSNFNQLTYKNVYGEGIDLSLTQNTTHRKLDYLINSKNSLGTVPNNAEWLIFEEKVELPNGWTAQITGNTIEVKDVNGQIQFVFEKPVFKDSPVHTHGEELLGNVDHTNCSANHNGHELIGNYELVQIGNLLTIKTKVPLSWLLAEGRVYPVIIDPTVNCVPDNTANWTGYHQTSSGTSSELEGSATYTSTAIASSNSGNILLGRSGGSSVNLGWIKYNITSIPDISCITSARVQYKVNSNASDQSQCRIWTRSRHMSTDPSVAFNVTNNPIRLSDIRDGNIYDFRNLALNGAGNGWKDIPLASNISDLTAQLPSNWFSVGLNTYAGANSHTTCTITVDGYSSAEKPILIVNYLTNSIINAGSDQIICSGSNLSLNGSVPVAPGTTALFSENFESYANISPLPTVGTTWKMTSILASTWNWQIKNTCTPTSGTRCLNMRDGGGVDCDYSWDNDGNKIAWYGTLIDATQYTDVKLNFKWKGNGESGYDFGNVVYSFDGLIWTDVNGSQYHLQNTWQTVSNLSLSALNGQQFFIGFRWSNDGATGAAPGFNIDDISITGTPIPSAFSWSGGPIVSGGTSMTPIVNPIITTNYILSSAFGSCNLTDQVTVTVLPGANPPTSISATNPLHPAYCHGNTVNLTSVGGTAAGGGIVDVWYEHSCNTVVEETWSTSPLLNAGWWIGSTTINSVNGILNVTSTGADPMIYLGNLSINPDVYRYVQVRYRYVSGPATPGMQVFFENGSGLAESKSQRGTMIMDGSWHYLNLDMSLNYSNVNSGWIGGGTVTGLRFDFCENTGMVMEFDFFLVSESRMIGDQANLVLNPGDTYYPTTSTQYFTRKIDNCGATSCASTNVNLPPLGTNLSLDGENETCLVNQMGWVHFYHTSGRLIASVNSGGQNLGNVTITSYVEGAPASVPACDFPLNTDYTTAYMQRHWVVTPQFQPATPVQVKLPFNNVEFTNLVGVANTNPNGNDDLLLPDDLKLTKYSGPLNVNDDAVDNCPSNGGSGGATIHTQTGTNVTTLYSLVTGAQYAEYPVPSFSELWLHGSLLNSPLPVELVSLAAVCEENGNDVKVRWTTASEQNSSHFTVERSVDGINWLILGTVNAAGTSTSNLNYEMIDSDTRGYSVIYYRLNQFDNNGVSKAYGPISAECLSEQLDFEVFPNPAGNEVTVLLHGEHQEGQTSIHITDINGKEVKTIFYSEQVGKLISVDLRNLEQGVYIVRLVNGEENNQFVRLVKQ